LKQAYGEAAFKGNIEMVTAIYPKTKVSKGDEWEISTKMESGMSGNINSTYKLSESTKEYYVIDGQSKITTEDKDAYVEMNGVALKYDIAGTMTSMIKIDKLTGWIIEANINQVIQGDTYIKENPEMPNGMKIPMVMKNKMVFSNK
jgi:hypothetical protein